MIDNLLDKALIRKAVESLIRFEVKEEKGKHELIEGRRKLIVAQIQLFKDIQKPVMRPVRVKIPNTLFSVDVQDHSICLFCKTDEKTAIEEYIQKNPISGLDRIISITELKKNYAVYKNRKQLLTEYSHFLCDAGIMTQLYNLLGKDFGSRNNWPVPIEWNDFSKLAQAIAKAVDSTYMYLKGKNLTVAFGHVGMKTADVTENVLDGLRFAADKLPSGGWKTVHSVHLKTSTSPALPIYTKVASVVLQYISDRAAAPEIQVAPVSNIQGKKQRSVKQKKSDTLPMRVAESASIQSEKTKKRASDRDDQDSMIQKKVGKKLRMSSSTK